MAVVATNLRFMKTPIRGSPPPWGTALLSVGIVLVALTLASTNTSAHVGEPEGRIPVIDDEGRLIAASTTWGLVFGDEGCPRRVCEEAIGAAPRWYHFAADGRVLLGTAFGILVTSDRGCSYTPGPDSVMDIPALLGVSDGSTLVVATSGDEPNQLLISTDDGLSFEAATDIDGVIPVSLKVTGSGQRIVLGGIRLLDGVPVVYSSEDGGETFAIFDQWGEDIAVVNIVGFDEAGRVALALVDATTGATELWLAPADLVDPFVVGMFAGTVTDFAAYADRHFVIVNRLVLQSGPAGATSDGFAEVPDGPTRCLVLLGDGRLWGCAVFAVGFHFLVTDDGDVWSGVLPPESVDERVCPQQTAGYATCFELFGLAPILIEGECVQTFDGGVSYGDGDGDGDGDDGGNGNGDGGNGPEPASPPGCACHSSSRSGPLLSFSLLGMFVMVAAIRRRW